MKNDEISIFLSRFRLIPNQLENSKPTEKTLRQKSSTLSWIGNKKKNYFFLHTLQKILEISSILLGQKKSILE